VIEGSLILLGLFFGTLFIGVPIGVALVWPARS
jgi:hypothetical protein